MIYPTRRAILLTALGAPVALGFGLAMSRLWLAAPAWCLLVGVGVLLDWMLAGWSSALEVETTIPRVLAAGGEGLARFQVRFKRGPVPREVEVILEADPRIAAEPPRGTVRPENRAFAAEFRLVPRRRGDGRLTALWLRWRGPLGLVWKQTTQPLDAPIPITPNIPAVKEEAMRLFSRDALFGAKIQLETGGGTEFHALKDHVSGMDRRAVDWKQSARHGRLLTKEYRTERNHHIILALDCGRAMSDPLAGLPRIDRAINAALLLAYVCLRIGDRVGLFAFDARPRLSTKVTAGVNSFGLLQRLASRIEYSGDESNYTLALTTLGGELERRSLIVVFTDFTDSTSAELMIENIGRLIRRHLVLFVVLRDEELESLAALEPHTADDVSRAVTAEALLRERETVITRLRRMGVRIVDAPAERIGPALLSAYLDVKRKDLL
ncbi:uncharacterized protein (DUF58 family) [Caulobacter ginsengisoli]|uniref:Uncharacterized protein (DUF58 family) n=1 Tax=Caulobacter ginsengisoli TaxID=400775 RepID=A0ABU0IXY1_9CAUL|nr:DUF58 domain-containing protein [Caulobacter ginsengisoli]MDQ0465812.1 uncharacterized protein (DUF58 family) [Caulobacter ginsengisoli]